MCTGGAIGMKVAGIKHKLPNGWRWARCEEVIDVRDGTHDTPKYVTSGYPLITSKNLKPEGIDFSTVSYISEKDHFEISKRSKVDRGDILLAMIGTIGNPVIVDVDKDFSIKNVALFKFSKSIIDARYFKYLLETPIIKRQLNLEERGGTQKFVSLKALRNILFPFPSLEEQRRLAAILDKADAVRKKRQQAIQLTEELLRATFLDMFGDPVTNPKEWNIVELKTTFERNPQIGTIKPAHSDGKQLVVRVGEIGNQNVNLQKCGRITLEGKELDNFCCQPGDLLLARAIGSESHLGKASILQSTKQVVVFDSHVMRLRFLPEAVSPVFFLQWLKTKGGRTRFMQEAGRTAVQFNVNAQQISRVQIPLPPIGLQKQFVRFYEKTLKYIGNYEGQQQTIDNLFNSLMHRAFRGEL
jgi:type I restriction enzyme S subunit